MAKAGHTFSKWNTKADGTGTDYAAGATITGIQKDVTLYAVWTANTHKVSVSSIDHITITATPAGASAIAEGGNNATVAYGTVVTLAQTADTHYTFGDWTVTKDGEPGTVVAVSEGSFTMPDYDVVVSASVNENAKRDVVFYSNGEQVGAKVITYVGEAPASAPTAVYESCLEGSNLFYGWTTEQWDNTIDASALAGKTVYRTLAEIPNVTADEGDVNYYAIWAKGSESATSYKRATAMSDLSGVSKIVIVSNRYSNLLTTTPAGVSAPTESEGNISITAEQAATNVWNLSGNTTSGWVLKTSSNAPLCATAISTSSNNNKGIDLTTTANSTWTIGKNTNNSATDLFYLRIGAPRGTDTKACLDYYSSTWQTYYTTDYASNQNTALRLYVPETTYSEFRTNCCSLKPVTNLAVSSVSETSVTLAWTAPASTEGITKLQVVNADNGNVLKDDISASATSAEVTDLTKCDTYNLKVVSVGADCSSNSAVVSATPQEAAKTVTFKYNDDVTADVVESTTCSAEYVNVPANPTRSGYRFMGWKNGDDVVSGTTFTPEAASTTINATWAQLYTVHYDFDGVSGAPADVQYIAGEEVTLTATEPNKGVLAPFKAWSFSPSVTLSAGKFAMPAEDVTITATYDEIVGQWMLVTDESMLKAGDTVVIAAASANKAMKTTQGGSDKKYREITDITKSGSIIENPSNDVQIFVLEEGTVDNSWAFKCANGEFAGKYIYANSGSNNTINSQTTNDANSSWKLNIANGTATAQGTNTRNVLQYNNDRFACYESASQSAIAFYVFREGTFYDVNMPAVTPTGGSVSANTSMAKAGETVTLTYAPSRGYTVETLTVTGASGSVAISPDVEAGVTEYTFTMP